MLPQQIATLLSMFFIAGFVGASSPQENTHIPEPAATDPLIEDLDSIFDEDDPYESEARFFNFDRGNAFNTSVAFTIPLFSFTLPGAADSVAAGGLEGNVIGVLSFVAFFLLGGLGIAIYTTSQGGNEDSEEARYIGDNTIGFIYDALSGLPDALDLESCSQLSVCNAHAYPQSYGILGILLRMLFPVKENKSRNELTSYEKAALYGHEDKDECFMEYSCLIDPLDSLVFLKDLLIKQ